jgi:hypothetical protein
MNENSLHTNCSSFRAKGASETLVHNDQIVHSLPWFPHIVDETGGLSPAARHLLCVLVAAMLSEESVVPPIREMGDSEWPRGPVDCKSRIKEGCDNNGADEYNADLVCRAVSVFDRGRSASTRTTCNCKTYNPKRWKALLTRSLMPMLVVGFPRMCWGHVCPP